jgi:hypothetical protein
MSLVCEPHVGGDASEGVAALEALKRGSDTKMDPIARDGESGAIRENAAEVMR